MIEVFDFIFLASIFLFIALLPFRIYDKKKKVSKGCSPRQPNTQENFNMENEKKQTIKVFREGNSLIVEDVFGGRFIFTDYGDYTVIEPDDTEQCTRDALEATQWGLNVPNYEMKEMLKRIGDEL